MKQVGGLLFTAGSGVS